MSQTTTQNINK